ncbi:MAG: hypothetical protein VXX79_19300, partial [Pseudomonadota bacterium]|nr:hypothetical protein [Pseudomonadota bacterium]
MTKGIAYIAKELFTRDLRKSFNHPDATGHSRFDNPNFDIRIVGDHDIYLVKRGNRRITGSEFVVGAIVILTGMNQTHRDRDQDGNYIDNIDYEKLRTSFTNALHDFTQAPGSRMDLLRKLLRKLGPLHFGVYHWGCTTQNRSGAAREICREKVENILSEVWGNFRPDISASKTHFLTIEPELQVFSESYPVEWRTGPPGRDNQPGAHNPQTVTQAQLGEMNKLIPKNRPVQHTPVYSKFGVGIHSRMSNNPTTHEIQEDEANFADFKQAVLASYAKHVERKAVIDAQRAQEGLEWLQMRKALDILYADAKVVEEHPFTCLDNAYDKHVAHQATHQVSLDPART